MDDNQGSRMTDNFAPVPDERDAAHLPVKGRLPAELCGTLYRNGPNPQFPDPAAHWFVGDGMIHAVTLEEGGARYRNRWVRTPKWLAEHAAGRSLFGGFGQPRPDAPPGIDGGVANTNILQHGGRLLALEEAHLPMEMEPGSLATRGYHDFAGAVAGPFTAHPKIDPETGEMLFFGYHANGWFSPTMSYGAIGADGSVSRFGRFEAPFSSMVHDFMVTRNHVLFPVLPLTGSLERARTGRPPYAWEPEKGSAIGLMRRDGALSDIRWFRGEACYVFHVMNAWEEGERIHADVMQMEAPSLFPRPDGSPAAARPSPTRLCRWSFDLAAGTDGFQRRYLDDLDAEFPRIDDRRAGLAYRHGWCAAAGSGRVAGTFDSIAHFDLARDRRTLHALPAGDAPSEPVFVPRSADAPEGDGWILAVIWRAAENRSDLAVFEATAIDAGPVATVELPARVPFGFHGNWVAA